MKRRIPKDRCPSCGGPCTKPCVDNFGGKYLGCDRGCRIKTLAEIREMEQAGAMAKPCVMCDAKRGDPVREFAAGYALGLAAGIVGGREKSPYPFPTCAEHDKVLIEAMKSLNAEG